MTLLSAQIWLYLVFRYKFDDLISKKEVKLVTRQSLQTFTDVTIIFEFELFVNVSNDTWENIACSRLKLGVMPF